MKYQNCLKTAFNERRGKSLFNLCSVPASIVLLTLFSASCSNRPVATVASETEAIEIVDVLRENDIDSQKVETGDDRSRQYRIEVTEDSINGDAYAAAIQILRDHCLPHSEPPPVQEGGLVASIEAERAKVQRQLQLNIISQLRKLPGATCVYVNFVMPQQQLSTLNPYGATASVLVAYKTPQPSFTDAEVKSLVAGSVPNLQPEKVSVKLAYQPVRPPPRTGNAGITRVLLIGAVALAVILGSVSLIYLLQKRRQKNAGRLPAESSAPAKHADDFPEAETIK
jgi:type III secretory pathway lipoprotein EscJ